MYQTPGIEYSRCMSFESKRTARRGIASAAHGPGVRTRLYVTRREALPFPRGSGYRNLTLSRSPRRPVRLFFLNFFRPGGGEVAVHVQTDQDAVDGAPWLGIVTQDRELKGKRERCVSKIID